MANVKCLTPRAPWNKRNIIKSEVKGLLMDEIAQVHDCGCQIFFRNGGLALASASVDTCSFLLSY
jgi:hypothetical protein